MHAALLALLVFGLAIAPKFEDSPEAIPVETVSQSELNQIMNGEKDAKPAPEPPPTPQAAPTPPTPPAAPPDLRASEEPTPPPKPEPPSKPEPAPPPKPAPPPPPKPTAEDAPEPPTRPKLVETPPERPKEPQEKPKPDTPKPAHPYDPNAIAKLIGQNKPAASASATGATAATPQGLPHHDAPHMSVSMASALDAWLTESYLNCWTPPPTMPEGDVYVAQIKVVFNADGSLSARPVLINPPTDPAWRAHAESAMRAVKKCDPLHVPPQYTPYFDQWKVETIHFDPRATQG
jgi:colicin import membrane protein